MQEINGKMMIIDSNDRGKKRIDIRPFSEQIGIIGFYDPKI